ncbi:MAG: DUF2851 family protein [Ignavibacteria bacterium]|nr:DUF2851 family protein [Ignavibacteria bacterium]
MKIREKAVYEIWKEGNFKKALTTSDAQAIEVIDTGMENKDFAGPDFLNARIKFGNITYLGDVEIDSKHKDWKSHGHYFDKKYSKVILHITLSNEKHRPFVFTKDKRKVHSLCILDFIDAEVGKTLLRAVQMEQRNKSFIMPCKDRNALVSKKEKTNFLIELGIERFQNKARKILERTKQMIYLKEMNIREPIVRYDFGEDFDSRKFKPEEFSNTVLWQQIIYEMIFEALGFSKNKDLMLKLAKAVNIDFLIKYSEKENFELLVESVLLNVSGLIPEKISFNEEKASEYVREMVEIWDRLKSDYDGMYFKQEHWHFFKQRPQNFPTIRIAGGARLLHQLLKENLFEDLIELFEKEGDSKDYAANMRNLMVIEAEGFWRDHYVFDKPAKEILNYFVGISRVDEIVINVLLPILSVYLEIFNKSESLRRVKELYINYNQKTSNQLADQVNSTLILGRAKERSILYQGMIELFRNYCVKERCLECKIGAKIFN